MMRWGLLGPGGIAEKAFVPAVRGAGHALEAVGSRDPDRARAFAAAHDARAAGSYDDVLANERVEAVYIALPNDLHAEWATKARAAGRHVLCEKPLTHDVESTRALAEAATDGGPLLMEAAMAYFHPRMQALLEAVQDGRIGAVVAVDAAFTYPMRKPANYRERLEHGGGALLDVGYYGVAASRWVTGQEPFAAVGFTRRGPTGVDVLTSAALAFPSGVQAQVRAGFEGTVHQWLSVLGTQGVLATPHAYNPGEDIDAVLLLDGAPIGTWRADPYAAMLRAFEQAVEGGAQALPPSDAVGSAEALELVRSSLVDAPPAAGDR